MSEQHEKQSDTSTAQATLVVLFIQYQCDVTRNVSFLYAFYDRKGRNVVGLYCLLLVSDSKEFLVFQMSFSNLSGYLLKHLNYIHT